MGKLIKVEETEFKPQSSTVSKSFADEERDLFIAKLQGYAASCEVEINRIAAEGGVRIGNSILAERYAIDEVSKALKKIQDKYLSYATK
jgi:hypothetical protein